MRAEGIAVGLQNKRCSWWALLGVVGTREVGAEWVLSGRVGGGLAAGPAVQGQRARMAMAEQSWCQGRGKENSWSLDRCVQHPHQPPFPAVPMQPQYVQYLRLWPHQPHCFTCLQGAIGNTPPVLYECFGPS